ncbi:MAG: SCP2 sterol-binding domain-containing protein [Lachnospiraceae bacterium]|nr:SCP2 sterol-binding domain-containing protein [Lachnospiraceae bacterium]
MNGCFEWKWNNDFIKVNKLLDGKLDPVLGFSLGKLKVDGDVGKALEFSKLIK